MMVASCVVDAAAATARGNSGTGTTDGSKVDWVGASNARPTPKTKTMASMNSLFTHPETDAERQGRCRKSLDRLAELQQATPVVAVGDLARHQHEGGAGQELHERRPGRGRRRCRSAHTSARPPPPQHLVAHGGAGPRAPIERERPVPQDGVRHGVGSWVMGGRQAEGLRPEPGVPLKHQPLQLRPAFWRAGLPAEAARRRRLVEPRGVEPLTSSLRTRRSPN